MIKFIEIGSNQQYKNGIIYKVFSYIPVYTFHCNYNGSNYEFECPVEKIDNDWFIKSNKTLKLYNIENIDNENPIIDDDLPHGSVPSNALVRMKFLNDRYKI